MSETGEALEVGVEDVAPQREAGVLAMALDVDEAGVLELFHVMGKGGRADGLLFGEAGAGRGAFIAADLGEDFVAARFGESLGDKGELLVGEADGLFAGRLLCHDPLPYYSVDWPSGQTRLRRDLLDWLRCRSR